MIGTPYFQRTSKRILQNINSNMEKTDQGMNLHRISIGMKGPGEGNILETLQLIKLVFPYSPFGRPDARVQMPSSETQSPMKVRMAQRMRAT